MREKHGQDTIVYFGRYSIYDYEPLGITTEIVATLDIREVIKRRAPLTGIIKRLKAAVRTQKKKSR